jgi:Xaa-Pro dipeptidase
MKEFGIQAVVLEPGPAMVYLTGVRWGRSERTFAAVIPAEGEPSYVLPGFEEMRARELIRIGGDIRVWQEDESPYRTIADIINNKARVGIDASVRFFVFDQIRKEAPRTQYINAETVLKKAGVDLTPAPRRR